MSAIMNFESAVYVNEQLNRLMVNAAQDLAQRSIKACAEHYNFDAEEALRLLGLINVKLARAKPIDNKPKKEKVVVAKPAFPMPYNGEFNLACCAALRQNSGLYTQCQAIRKGDKAFCKQCQVSADKNEGIPEYGTMEQRQAVGIFDYVDPKGRKPIAFAKIMKKYKLTKEQVLEEAGKFNINIDEQHFVVEEVDSKRGRPASKAGEKEPKEKGAKGRPKKAKKVLQIEGEGDDDLFAALVADANAEAGENTVVVTKKKGKSDEEKEAERLAKEQEKEAKKLALEKAKAEKEAKLAAEKAEREAKKEAERLEREAKKAAEEAEKLAKKEALELAKKEKEAKIAAEKLAKEASKTKKPAAKAVEQDDEPDVVKKIEFEGKKYLKSKKTGIIYDYNEYTKNGEQVVVGKWNDAKNKIDLNDAGEESEEEYDM